jgi:hypothetical protein
MRVGVAALQAILAAADGLGRAAHRVRPVRPAAADVAALFDASPARAAAIARAMSGTRYQNRALVAIARRRGVGILEDLVDPASVDALRPFVGGAPAIFACWHVGPPFGLAGAFEAVGLRLLLLRHTLAYGSTPTLEVAPIQGGVGVRRAAFRQAIARLRAGGSVLLPLDVRDAGQTAPAPCFGRARPMARGPFALARLTGAAVVPLAARLDADRRVRVAIGSPLTGAGDIGDARAFEDALAVGAAAWLEAFLRASPAQLRRCSLRWLLEAPRIA